MPGYRTTRPRPGYSLTAERKAELVTRVIDFFDADLRDSQVDRDMRIQRHAKLRGWTEGRNYPWDDASDASIPDIQTHSWRLQDTLHNAVMSGSPVVAAKAASEQDQVKQKSIDALIDHQVFVEGQGEHRIETLIQQFVDDGVFTVFVHWVKERRKAIELRRFDPLDPAVMPGAQFEQIVRGLEGIEDARPLDNEGWDWELRLKGEKVKAGFYTLDPQGDMPPQVELRIMREVQVHDGPVILPIAYDDVFYPARAANLQIPSPSNPGGAAHVIVRSMPTIDEIERLVASGMYDRVTEDDLAAMQGKTPSGMDEDAKQQKDTMGGRQAPLAPVTGAESHAELTRLMCFDMFDIDDDGVAEDIVCWVIKETRTLLRCVPLSEFSALMPPRRPLAEAALFPVEGRRAGLSIPEALEGLHDLNKMIIDQTIDTGTITSVPFGFYRAAGGNRPEVIKFAPGELYPLADPSKDINFPQLSNQGVAYGINMMTMVGSWQERLTNIGDLQLGRVPAGRSSALRTIGGMQMVAGQGEARPERILRRLFTGLTDIWSMIHQLNMVHLDRKKEVRLRHVKSAAESPYVQVSGGDIRTQAIFSFKANAYNASKAATQQALASMGVYVLSPVALQAGVVGPEEIYRYIRDVGQSNGIDPDDYIRPPSAEVNKPRWLAVEAIHEIMNNAMPECAPAEMGGAQEHLQNLLSFARSQEVGLLTPEQAQILRAYISQVQELVRAQMYQQRMAQAMQTFAQGQQGPMGGGEMQPGAGAQGALAGPPAISGPGEMLDETMPSAGGGGNAAMGGAA